MRGLSKLEFVHILASAMPIVQDGFPIALLLLLLLLYGKERVPLRRLPGKDAEYLAANHDLSLFTNQPYRQDNHREKSDHNLFPQIFVVGDLRSEPGTNVRGFGIPPRPGSGSRLVQKDRSFLQHCRPIHRASVESQFLNASARSSVQGGW